MSNKKSPMLRISEISYKIAKTLEQNFSSVRLQGEMSNFISHSSGHWYFNLKEKEAQIKAVMFKSSNQKLSFLPKNGEEFIARGRITVYVPRGTYQIVCNSLESLGSSGDLQKKFLELKAKLQKEGLFDLEHKKSLPLFPKHIALITSPTGAAIKDILHVLKRRFRGLRITLIPALVQGEEAPKSLVVALKEAQKIKTLDALIIGRGGGSAEDLWAFNSEDLAREIFSCHIPVVSAVGHEIDFTLSDFVSDLRAPTPSVAGELVVKNAEDVVEKCSKIEKQLVSHIKLRIQFLKEKIQSLDKQIPRPKSMLEDLFQKVDDLDLKLVQEFRKNIKSKMEHVHNLKKLLYSLNPEKVMERGFSIATLKNGEIIKSSKQISAKSNIHLQFFKGHAEVLVERKD